MATAQARLRELLPGSRATALLLALRANACFGAWWSGFRALSDDDYARISIAQGFAQLPRLDPTGSSWLPAPFWLYGAAFRLFGPGLTVARATAVAASLAATVLVAIAARVLGAGKWSSYYAALLTLSAVPYSILLGIAAVPEVPCAALILFGAATLVRPDRTLRALGGLALTFACLSRYEAWPVAGVFLVYCGCDAQQERDGRFAACGLLGVAGAAGWLLLGHLNHGHALFFVTRVTAYKRALGGHETGMLNRLLEYPTLLFKEAPLLWILDLVLALATRGQAIPSLLPRRRVVVALLALLLCLINGSVNDGVPTHHAARVLLPLWFYACVTIAPRALVLRARGAWPWRVLALAALVYTPVSLVLAPPTSEFDDRTRELEAGTAARQFTASNLAIDTPDYGYTAVQAAFGTPISTRALDEHDPRHPDPDPFASPQALDAALRERSARFALVTAKHAPLLTKERGFTELWRSEAFVLFAWKPSPAS